MKSKCEIQIWHPNLTSKNEIKMWHPNMKFKSEIQLRNPSMKFNYEIQIWSPNVRSFAVPPSSPNFFIIHRVISLVLIFSAFELDNIELSPLNYFDSGDILDEILDWVHWIPQGIFEDPHDIDNNIFICVKTYYDTWWLYEQSKYSPFDWSAESVNDKTYGN